jgi:hypothetical protein
MFHKDLASYDLHAPSQQLIENNSGSTIPGPLKCVTFNGMGLNFPQIRIANGSVDKVRGLTEAAIPTGMASYIWCLGFMFNVNTSSWGEGTFLFCDASGNLTTTPTGSLIATVIAQDATAGVLFLEGMGGSGGGGTGDVVGPGSSTDKAIVRWNGTSGNLIQNSQAIVQDSGAIQAQAFVFNRQILGDVTVPNHYSVVSTDLELLSGDIILGGDATLLLI